MMLIAILILIALASLLVWTFTYKVSTIESSLRQIAEAQAKMPKVMNGVDGHTPVKGIDYQDGQNGSNGLNGKSSVSKDTSTIIIKETPVKGDKGDKGESADPAPLQVARVNPSTGDLETKYDNTDFWQVLIPCKKLLAGCPDNQSIPNGLPILQGGLQ